MSGTLGVSGYVDGAPNAAQFNYPSSISATVKSFRRLRLDNGYQEPCGTSSHNGIWI